ncbi:MAG: crossover junction endodeoxyribonuclease RuvC [Actinomycetota bacterium]|nr:crossover junction endodeoxyribonuclease RuvC [Actinomycetota bacterium]
MGLRVLGVDPGLTRCGLGVVDSRPGRRVVLVDVGVVRTPAGADLAERLLAVAVALDTWLDRHNPDVVAVERVFSQHNVRTVMGTAQASGVAVLAAARRALPVTLHTPSEVKAAVTGSGRAGKEQVTTMVTRILGLAEPPRPADAADALALAICHLWRDGRGAAAAGQASSGATPAQRRWLEAAEAARKGGGRILPSSGRGARRPGACG